MVDIKQAAEELNAKACNAFRGTSAKADKGKLKLSLVPTQIIRDIAQVREYGCEKYHDPDNWKSVEDKAKFKAGAKKWLSAIVETLQQGGEINAT